MELAPALKKKLSTEKEILNPAYIQKYTKKFIIPKGKIKYDYNTLNNVYNNHLGILGYYYKDKFNVQEIDYGLFYETKKYYLDIKKWKLWDNKERRDGKYLDAYYKFNKLKAGVQLGKYENYTHLFPYIKYDSTYTYQFYQKITGKEQKSFCAVDKHLTTSTFEISKYKGYQKKYKEMTKYWWSTALSKIKSNNQFTPQFQYLLKEKDLGIIENYFYINGWYQFNTTPTDCYYSPNFIDNTLLEWHPVYKGLEGIFKYGYSFKDSVYLKTYGFDYQDKFISFDCSKNYSFKSGTGAYWYEECNLKAGVKW